MIDPKMTASSTRLPRRDWVILPLVSLLTVLVMLVTAEAVARKVWYENEFDGCTYEEASYGPRHRPNCTTTMKNAEGPLLTYHFNECGYRSEVPCGPKPAGAFRIAVLGTSVGMGLYVPYESLFTVGAAAQLQQACHRQIDVQNLSGWGSLTKKSPLAPEILNLHPDVLVVMVSPFDLNAVAPEKQEVVHESGKSQEPLAIASLSRTVLTDMMNVTRNSRAMVVAQHYLLTDDRNLTLAYEAESHVGDVLHQPCTPLCESRYAAFQNFLENLSTGLKNSIPIVILPIPNRIAAAMLSDGIQVPGLDPNVFAARVSQIAQNYGAKTVDVFGEFSRTQHSQSLFYIVDGHPREGVHAILARALADYLASHMIPGCSAGRRDN